MTRIWLDTDIGSDIDDAMALLLCLRLPDVSLVGVTTVYGQVELRARIARRLLDLAGNETPVAYGESLPVASRMPVWHTGEEGKGLLSEADLLAWPSEFNIRPDGVDMLCRTSLGSRLDQ